MLPAHLALLLAALAAAPTEAPLPTEFGLLAPQAKAVALVGEMNGWDPKATPMARDARGTWRATVPLEGGHSFRFLNAFTPELLERTSKAVAGGAKGR